MKISNLKHGKRSKKVDLGESKPRRYSVYCTIEFGTPPPDTPKISLKRGTITVPAGK